MGGATEKFCIFPAEATSRPNPFRGSMSQIGWLPPAFHFSCRITSIEELMGNGQMGSILMRFIC